MKSKKRKAIVDFILEEMANGIDVYLHEEDEVGVCGYCRQLSYKPHQESCPVKLARELLGRKS
jgi:hypothetical protein